MFDDILERKNNLIKERYNLIKKLETLDKDIKNENYNLAKLCKSRTGHKWISVRESGSYGEKFTYCKFCKIDLYEDSFHD